jgi:16S rRNA processing protein RimM
VNGRTAAEALKGAELFVPRTALPKEDADEFYHADLIGLRAEDTEGRAMGMVRALHNFGAGNVIELVRDDGDEVFLPFTREVAQQIDIEGGRIVIAAPEEVEAGEKGNVE